MKFPSPKSSLNLLLGKAGYRVVKLDSPTSPLHFDMDLEFQPIFEKTREYTMTTMANMYALYKAIKYICEAEIPGDIAECGVWKGGSTMIAALTLLSLGETNRRLWLYDTYAGMAQPAEIDIGPNEFSPQQRWENAEAGGLNTWNNAALDEVKQNLYSTDYPQDKMNFVEGKVEDTIPGDAPEEIALLRLDTDFYESTYHELEHLFPRLSPNGVLIIDDYGWWKGSREATDKYFAENQTKILLHRVDPSSRVAVKT